MNENQLPPLLQPEPEKEPEQESEEPQPTPDPRQLASPKVLGPAISLIVTAGIGILLELFSIAMLILPIRLMDMMPPQPDAMNNIPFFNPFVQSMFSIVPSLIGVAIGVLIIFAGVKMMKLENRGLAYAASILAMIPCISPCCILGLPFGIWSLVVLADNDVKSAFR